MVVLDATTLFYLLDPDAKAPTDPQTGLPVPHVRERVKYLVSTLEKNRDKVVIPRQAVLREFDSHALPPMTYD